MKNSPTTTSRSESPPASSKLPAWRTVRQAIERHMFSICEGIGVKDADKPLGWDQSSRSNAAESTSLRWQAA
jgi:hypothetical protein